METFRLARSCCICGVNNHLYCYKFESTDLPGTGWRCANHKACRARVRAIVACARSEKACGLTGEGAREGEFVKDPDVKATVEHALEAGQRLEDIDMVVRARYAYEWGGGDALHLELADEVERLRTLVGVL
ncbi:Uncharacterised protein [Mycolicibacterium fortuitum]|uniref:Uncharacterized protein n=1 Tax=Mycolicibacterium fortuitum TaxID=1766 RepID=A0A378WCR5_MYCFO|nr:Uncharacterised protein [Mycolicibacterium fortuitum]